MFQYYISAFDDGCGTVLKQSGNQCEEKLSSNDIEVFSLISSEGSQTLSSIIICTAISSDEILSSLGNLIDKRLVKKITKTINSKNEDFYVAM